MKMSLLWLLCRAAPGVGATLLLRRALNTQREPQGKEAPVFIALCAALTQPRLTLDIYLYQEVARIDAFTRLFVAFKRLAAASRLKKSADAQLARYFV